jgi:hypothetical protein
MKKRMIGLLGGMIAAVVLSGMVTGASAADKKPGLSANDAKTMANVGKAAFDVSTHVIGAAPKPNPILTGIGLGQAAAGIVKGAKEGYGYQDWKKPEMISAGEGGRTVGYTAGVLTHRAVDAVKDTLKRR